MALLTTCSKKNLVVTQALQTEWTRTLVNSAANAVPGFYSSDVSNVCASAAYPCYADSCAYWRYDVKRTMEYSYVGLTKTAAEDAAQWLTSRFHRKRWPLVFNKATTATFWKANFSTGSSSIETALDDWRAETVKCASVAAEQEDGDAWTVSVSVDEEWTLPWKTSATSCGANYCQRGWTTFEANPNATFIDTAGTLDGTDTLSPWYFFLGVVGWVPAYFFFDRNGNKVRETYALGTNPDLIT